MRKFTPGGVAGRVARREHEVLPMAPRFNRNIARSLLVLSYPLRMAAHLTQRP